MYCLREELQVPHSIVGTMMVAIYSQGFWSLHPEPLSDLYLARLLGVLGRRATEHLLGGRRLLGTEHGLGTEHSVRTLVFARSFPLYCRRGHSGPGRPPRRPAGRYTYPLDSHIPTKVYFVCTYKCYKKETQTTASHHGFV